jgi:DNA-binding response OmpR family regulator
MDAVYEFGPFRLETVERRLLRDGHAVRLRGKVFDTLCVLVSRAGHLVEKDDLLAAVWPDTVVEENNNYSVHILDHTGKLHLLSRDEISKLDVMDGSMMPAVSDPNDAIHLVAFLARQSTRQNVEDSR